MFHTLIHNKHNKVEQIIELLNFVCPLSTAVVIHTCCYIAADLTLVMCGKRANWIVYTFLVFFHKRLKLFRR